MAQRCRKICQKKRVRHIAGSSGFTEEDLSVLQRELSHLRNESTVNKKELEANLEKREQELQKLSESSTKEQQRELEQRQQIESLERKNSCLHSMIEELQMIKKQY